jgi:hypothetical protein
MPIESAVPKPSIEIEQENNAGSRDKDNDQHVPKPDVFGPSDAVLSSHDNESAQD